MSDTTDAVVVGSGPNGLAAAITLAEAGHAVTLLEMADSVGGGVRSAESDAPGFVHDVCSAIHPFGRTSVFFVSTRTELAAAGLRWIDPPAAIGHPLDDQPAVILRGSVDDTAATLGDDGDAYRSLLDPLVNNWDELLPHMLAPFHVPWGPITGLRMARFGLQAITSAKGAAKRFEGESARALFAGSAAHSILPLSERFSAAAGIVMLASAHADGWPFPEGGSGRLSTALASVLEGNGGEIRTGVKIGQLSELPSNRAALFDVSPTALAEIATDRLHGRYRRALKHFRYGPGVFKVDLAIDGAIPWKDQALLEAGTVHLGRHVRGDRPI